MKPPFVPMDDAAEAARVAELKRQAKSLTPKSSELPPVPDEFTPSEFTALAGPWLRGLAEIHADGADDSGPRKSLAALRPLAWAVRLLGGSPREWRDSLLRAKTSAGAMPNEKQAAEIKRLSAMIAAAESWGGVDNTELRSAHEQATRAHEQLAGRIEPYRRAHLPAPDGWERSVFDAEREVSTTGAAWLAARERFDALNDQLQTATAKAYVALVGSLANVEARLGVRAAGIVRASDPEFLIAFPHRAPDELLALNARAERVNAIMVALDRTRPDLGMAHFWRACGEEVAEIVEGKVAATRGGYMLHDVERPLRERGPHPDHVMNQSF